MKSSKKNVNSKIIENGKKLKYKKTDKTVPRNFSYYIPIVDNQWANTISDNYNQLLVEGEFDGLFSKL